MDLSLFATPEAWISLVTLLFLEIVLGVDNLVFIAITTNRLPVEQQHLGRKLGLMGALVMRILFLCFASFLVHMTQPVLFLPIGADGAAYGLSVRDIVLGAGGAYLIYKGIVEVRSVLDLDEVREKHESDGGALKKIGLPQAVATIMVMDLVFSIDSVITAVGLADHLIIMIIAVLVAVIIMMVFIDPISDFINHHVEMKILALVFIVAIGALLILDAFHVSFGIEILGMHVEKLMVYFAMVFSIVLELVQMKYQKNYAAWVAAQNAEIMRAKSMLDNSGERSEGELGAVAVLESPEAREGLGEALAAKEAHDANDSKAPGEAHDATGRR